MAAAPPTSYSPSKSGTARIPVSASTPKSGTGRLPLAQPPPPARAPQEPDGGSLKTMLITLAGANIAEILVFTRALADPERDAVERYLRGKSGL